METIGEKIRRLRKSKGISQTTVSDTCGIKQSSYANIENGKTQNITIEIGKGIAKALDIPFNELFDIEITIDTESQDQTSEEIDKLWAALKEKNEELKEKSLTIKLLINEKENHKSIILNTVTRYSNHVLSFLNAEMRSASSDNERNNFERQINHELKNKQDMFESLIEKGFITQDDLENFNKEMEEVYGIFVKTANIQDDKKNTIYDPSNKTEDEIDIKYDKFAKDLIHDIQSKMTPKELLEESIRLEEELKKMNRDKIERAKNKVNR